MRDSQKHIYDAMRSATSAKLGNSLNAPMHSSLSRHNWPIAEVELATAWLNFCRVTCDVMYDFDLCNKVVRNVQELLADLYKLYPTTQMPQ